MKTQRHSHEFKKGLVFASVFVLTALGIGIFAVLHANQLEPLPPSAVPTISTSLKQPFYSVSIPHVQTISTDETKQTKHVSTTVVINNPSESPMQISPGLQMLMLVDNGAAYPMTAQYLPPGTVVGGQLNAKSTQTYTIDFELPLNVNPKTFSFQLDASYNPSQVGV